MSRVQEFDRTGQQSGFMVLSPGGRLHGLVGTTHGMDDIEERLDECVECVTLDAVPDAFVG